MTACNVIGMLAAGCLILFKRGDPVIMFYGLSASVLGGALFPVSALPEWIRWASYLVPHTYVITAVRNLLYAMPPYVTGAADLATLTAAMVDVARLLGTGVAAG